MWSNQDANIIYELGIGNNNEAMQLNPDFAVGFVMKAKNAINKSA